MQLNEKEFQLSKTQIVHQWLFEKIGSAEYGPGYYLNEFQIAQEMHFNRSCVREALNRLLAEGLIEKRTNRRMYVTRMDGDSELTLLEYRAVIEAGAALLAAQHKDSDGLEKLKKLHEDFQYCVNRNLWSHSTELNRKFHLQIVQLSHNRHLIDIYCRMEVKMNWVKRKGFPGIMQDVTVHAHSAILNAIEKGDGQLAYQSVLHHLLVKP